MEPKGSLSNARAPATCPYPEQPATWSILSHINRVHASPLYFFTTHFNIILPSTPRFSIISSTQYKILRTKTLLKTITLTQRSCHGLGKFVAGISPRKPGFDHPRPVHRGLWLAKWQWERVLLQVRLNFSRVSIIPPTLQSHSSAIDAILSHHMKTLLNKHLKR